MTLKYAKERYPKISVITIVFNCGSMIEKAIQSLLAQNYPNLEYLVLDGGSTDGTLDVIEKYRDKIDFFRSHPDNGPSAALNEGIDKATGDVIAWLNSDDYYMNDILLKVGEAFIENPDVEMVNFLGRMVRIDTNHNEIVLKTSTPDKMQLSGGIAKSLFPNCRAITRSAYDKYGKLMETLNGKRAIYTDYEFVKRLALHNIKNITLPVLGYTYLTHDSSLSFNSDKSTQLKMHTEKTFYIERLLASDPALITDKARKQLTRDYRKSLSFKILKDIADKRPTDARASFRFGLKKFGPIFAVRLIRAWISYHK